MRVIYFHQTDWGTRLFIIKHFYENLEDARAAIKGFDNKRQNVNYEIITERVYNNLPYFTGELISTSPVYSLSQLNLMQQESA